MQISSDAAAGLLMRPERSKAKTEAEISECEDETEIETNTKQ